jgi:hypothetical protein
MRAKLAPGRAMTEPLRSSSEVLDFLNDLDRSFIEQYPDEGPENA